MPIKMQVLAIFHLRPSIPTPTSLHHDSTRRDNTVLQLCGLQAWWIDHLQ